VEKQSGAKQGQRGGGRLVGACLFARRISDQIAYSRKPGFTETRLRPLARRRESTARPLLVLIRTRKPWVLERRRRLGWNVRFGMYDCAPAYEWATEKYS